MESENSESLEGDDCEVVVEDTLGCKQTIYMDDGETKNEPELVNVRVCEKLEDHLEMLLVKMLMRNQMKRVELICGTMMLF